MWGISDKYKLIKDFKKDVIDRAVVDVNVCTEIKVQKVAYRKNGRTVKYISIAFHPKNAPASKRMTNAEIDKSGLARPGESYDDVRKRLTPAAARKQMAAKSASEASEASEAYEPL
jgi:plasmid replication initiation protein